MYKTLHTFYVYIHTLFLSGQVVFAFLCILEVISPPAFFVNFLQSKIVYIIHVQCCAFCHLP